MEKFCFICGKKNEKLKNGYCKECYTKKTQLIDVPEVIKIQMCSKCGTIKVRNDWDETSVENIVLSNIEELEKSVKIKLNKINNGYEVIATKDKKEIHNVKVVINRKICPLCARKFCDYFEAVIQIRGSYDKRMESYITDLLILEEKKDKNSFYKIKNVKGGFDIVLGNKIAAENIAQILKKEFDCYITKTFKLNTKDRQGEDVYRNFICIRFT